MSLKSRKPQSPLAATSANAQRTDVERDPQWEELLQRLRISYWQYAKFLYRMAKEKAASFEGFEEYEAIDCIQACIAEISLCLEQRYLREKISSLRVKRADTEVRAWFGNDSLDLSDLVRSLTAATDRLSPQDSEIVSDVIIDQLFHDEIELPGFARTVVNGDTIIFTLLPDDAEKQLQYQENPERRRSLVGGHVPSDD